MTFGLHSGVGGARLLGPHLAAAMSSAFALATLAWEGAVRHHVSGPPAIPADLPIGVVREDARVCRLIIATFLGATLPFESSLPGSHR